MASTTVRCGRGLPYLLGTELCSLFQSHLLLFFSLHKSTLSSIIITLVHSVSKAAIQGGDPSRSNDDKYGHSNPDASHIISYEDWYLRHEDESLVLRLLSLGGFEVITGPCG